MSCCDGKTRVTLEYPIKYTHFVSYPTHCKHLGILAYHNLVEVVFPSILTGTTLPVSILECTTNTPVYDSTGAPVLPSAVEPNRPYAIYFCPIQGGYVISNLTCTPDVDETVVVEQANVKGVSKK